MGAGIPAGFTLAAARSIDDDGTFIRGWGCEGLSSFQDAWVVVLPGGKPAPYRGDLNGDGRVDGGDLGRLSLIPALENKRVRSSDHPARA
ncbi:MAG: hypothetical protein GY895_22790 [Phycisphaera sp.]|nr:hypothetical protein [Phycisphaera sp.]